MKTLNVRLQNNPYSIFINPSFKDICRKISKNISDQTLFIVSHQKLKNLFGQKLENKFKDLKCQWILIPEGEQHKNFKTLEKILTTLSQKKAHRQSTLLAFGGGVVGDITGLAASLYMRGIRFFQMPTTLLAQVDSSVGGKTAVDLKTGKNLAGAFYQPQAVFIVTDFLKTLPQNEFANGMAEVIKSALIKSPKLYRFLKNSTTHIQKLKSAHLENMIFECVKIKKQIVEKDEKEQNLRAILNYGHTLGHAIEVINDYKKFKHGQAVAMGLSFASHLADRLELSHISTHIQVVELLNQYNLPSSWPAYKKSFYRKALSQDKKFNSQKIRFILPKKLGKVEIVPLTIEEILKWL